MHYQGNKHVKTFTFNGIKEYFITIISSNQTEFYELLEETSEFIKTLDGKIFRQEILGSANNLDIIETENKRLFNELEWPLNKIESTDGFYPVLNCFFHVICGPELISGEMVANTRGSFYDDGLAKYLYIKHDHTDHGKDAGKATQSSLDALTEALQKNDFTFNNTIRTWFYLNHILDWYGGFNKVRNAFFEAHGIFDGIVPASTGIGLSSNNQLHLNPSLLAIKNKEGKISRYDSPRQCSALDYGSSFSRATGIKNDVYHKIWVSGTASIDGSGKTIHLGDVDKQIAYTMEVVDAILSNAGFNWQHVVRAVAYLRNSEDHKNIAGYIDQNNMHFLPLMVNTNVVCRDDLLFEIEVDAVSISA